MTHLIYSAISSIDGFIEDAHGWFDWAMPDDEVHAYFNDLERTIDTYLYGRRMYETMIVWETDPSIAASSPLMRDFAETWQAADKIVFSRTLQTVPTSRTRIERDFNPETISRLKASVERNIAIAGPNLAAHAFKAGLIDECHMFLVPIIVGGGKPALPENIRLELELLEEHRFDSGMVHLRYQARGDRHSQT